MMPPPPGEQPYDQFLGTVLLGIVKPLVDNGTPPSAALRFATVMLLENAYGPKVFEEIGVPLRTWMRWRSEVREHMSTRPPLQDEPPAEFIAAVAELQKRFTAPPTDHSESDK